MRNSKNWKTKKKRFGMTNSEISIKKVFQSGLLKIHMKLKSYQTFCLQRYQSWHIFFFFKNLHKQYHFLHIVEKKIQKEFIA
jgi:hypothetical protein